jgi:hypothetical protein
VIEKILIMDEDLMAKKRSKDMKEGFETVLQIMITKIFNHGRNLSVNDFRKEERRVIELSISPFIKFADESLRLR